MQPAAFRACYADWKLVKTRGVVQVVLEVPLHDADEAYTVLNGMPQAAQEQWFAVAALQVPPAEKETTKDTAADSIPATPRPVPDKPPVGAKRDWRDISPTTQAGIRCDDPIFQAFLREQHADEWHEAQSDPAECVRLICEVQSRSELTINQKARVIWAQLDSEFQTWKMMEHA